MSIMNHDPVLNLIIEELANIYHCHTIILYGSRARGDYTATSDYDVMGITSTGEKKRIARFDDQHQVYLDIFIYPETDFHSLQEEHLRIADGIIVLDHLQFGQNLLSSLKSKLSEPIEIPSDEIEARKIWYGKMLSRASKRDVEGKYRHIWSVFSLLEDYFVFRGIRYQGPKSAFQYLEINDKSTLVLFDIALSNMNDLETLEKLIKQAIP